MVVLIIVLCSREEKMKGIINMDLPAMVSKKRDDYKSSLTVLCIFGVVLAIGIILYTCTELHKTVQIHTFLGDRTRRKWTTSHYWALILSFIGSIGTTIGLVGTIRDYSSFVKYRDMSEGQYKGLQVQTQNQYEEEQKQSEAFVKSYRRRQAFSLIRLILGI